MENETSTPWQEAAACGGHGLWVLGARDGLSATHTFHAQLGREARTLSEWLHGVHPDDRAELHAALRTASPGVRVDVTYRTPAGPAQRTLRLTGTLRGPGGLLCGAQVDVTEGAAREARLRRGAFHDPLTGLANRVLFIERLADTLARVQGGTLHAGLLFLDLNGFKQINDAYGHALGDILIACAAARLHETLGSSATLARYGGDEFTVLLEGAGEGALLDAARRVHAAFASPLELGPHRLHVNFAIGAVVLGARQGGAAEALEQADRAMYRAKAQGQAQGRAATCLHDDFSAHERQSALALEHALALALREGALQARYSPLRLEDRLVGAVVRAALPGREDLPLVDAAHGTPHALALDLWLLAHVAREPHAPGLLRLELAAHTPGAPEALNAVLAAQHAVQAGGGTLQIVLPAARLDAHARGTLSALRARGVEVALRGAEQLSLAELAALPVGAVLPHGPMAPLVRALAAELGWAVERATADDVALSREEFLQLVLSA